LPRTKKKTAVVESNDRTITVNRKAFHDYEILEKYEAGLVLTGTEIKSVRGGRVDLRDAYARPQNGELWLVNAHIAPYDPASVYNHDPRRPRKLLLHRRQIAELNAAVAQRGLTVVGLRVYIRNHVAKVELGLARGKRQYDKRQTMIERELDMDARRAVRAYE
jgi:SsrA-binding protein